MEKRSVDVDLVSGRLCENIHDINNALFVTKGFIEALGQEIYSDGFMGPEFDEEEFRKLFETVVRNVAKLDRCILGLRDFARVGIFQEPFSNCLDEGSGEGIPAEGGYRQINSSKE